MNSPMSEYGGSRPRTSRRSNLMPDCANAGDTRITMSASVSEPLLPSMASGECSHEPSSPFTSIPETFFRRRTGMTWLSNSRSEVSLASNRAGTLTRETSFEVENIGDIRAVDSGWLDDDVEEVMIVSKKDKKRRPLSVIVEASEAHTRSPFKPPSTIQVSVDANHFEYLESLHAGDACETILAQKIDDGRVYTVKLVRKSGADAERLAAQMRQEQQVLKLLTAHRAQYVGKLWWSFEDERAMYLVIDRTDGRTLESVVLMHGPLASLQGLICAAELAAGICELHDHRLIHANLRPQNVLVREDGHLLISDFEHARIRISGPTRDGLIGNKSTEQIYHAPEQALGWWFDGAVDWWSYGLILYWLFTGLHPFVMEADLVHPSIVHAKILHAVLPEDRLGLAEEAYNLVAQCLERNATLRIHDVGVKMHAYFDTIEWDDIAIKHIQAPFPSLGEGFTARDSEDTLQNRAPDDSGFHSEPFFFDWQFDLPCGDSDRSLLKIRNNLQALRMEQGQALCDRTIMPTQDSNTICEQPDDARKVTSASTVNLHDAKTSILPDVVATPHAGLPTPPQSRIGNLRKYSSLNFDDLDSNSSSISLIPTVDSSAQVARSQSTALLRKSKSVLGLSLESLRDCDDGASNGSGGWKGKLRKRTRPDTPMPVVPPTPPVPELPKGLVHIGSGIGYTYRGSSRRPTLNLASLTPRTCHGIFAGRRIKSGDKKKAKDSGSDKNLSGRSEGAASGSQVLPAEPENEEDLMDEVMRELYGDEWAGGVSPEHGGRGAIQTTGLGWRHMLTLSRFGMAEDASFAGPDSTLRLVTSPSTPSLDQ